MNVQTIYDDVCNSLLEPGGLQLGVLTLDDFLGLCGDDAFGNGDCRSGRFGPGAQASQARSRCGVPRTTLATNWQFSRIWKSSMPTAMKSAPFLKA